MDEPILSVNGITKRFGGLVALQDINFEVYPGEVVGLMGPNGAGKTTLLNMIAGEYPPDAGTIQFKGQEITRRSPHQICRLGIARTYQIPQPFATLSVRENLLVPAIFCRRLEKIKVEREEDRWLRLVNLLEKKNALAGDLSLLSLKKLELARALASTPELILLDEVAAGSTEMEIPHILTTLREIRNAGITIILVEHVMKVMVKAVDRIIVIDKGMKIGEGNPQAVMCDRKVIGAYFGV